MHSNDEDAGLHVQKFRNYVCHEQVKIILRLTVFIGSFHFRICSSGSSSGSSRIGGQYIDSIVVSCRSLVRSQQRLAVAVVVFVRSSRVGWGIFVVVVCGSSSRSSGSFKKFLT